MNQLDKKQALAKIDQVLALADKGQLEKATALYNEFANSLPDDVEVITKLGVLYLQLGDAVKAIAAFSNLASKHPENAEYLSYLGLSYKMNNQLQEAGYAFLKALEFKPDSIAALSDLSAIFIESKNYVEAEKHIKKALELEPKNAELLADLSVCLSITGRCEEALIYGEKSIRLNPKLAHAHAAMGKATSELGRMEEALSHFKKAIEADKSYGAAYALLAKIKKFSKDDLPFIRKTEKTLQTNIDTNSRAHIHFALGKIYDDCKEWEKAFEHYRLANVLVKSRFDETYSSNLSRELYSTRHWMKLSKKVFNKNLFQQMQHLGNDSEVPVFVVGMPRSGTTLVEQIIAGHPKAEGAGELKKLSELSVTICSPDRAKEYKKAWQEHLTTDKFTQFAEDYLAVLQENRKDALRIVDKMPDNYNHLGFGALLFPNSHIIHVTRNPLDTCLSCYFQSFIEVGWSCDFAHLVERYKTYKEVMKFWKSVLPENMITEVKYENLISEPENYGRQLIESCGLDWDPACLNYHQKKRTIATASVWQARQPIYKTSVKRWTNYAPYLAELANGLQEYLDDDDKEMLAEAGIKFKSGIFHLFK